MAELEAALLAPEHKDEALILRAAATGTEVLGRGDADPAAVLNVAIVKKEAAAAAA